MILVAFKTLRRKGTLKTKRYSITALMSNCIERCDDFESEGQSAIWNPSGNLVGRLNETGQGFLIFDTENGDVVKRELQIKSMQ